MLPRFCGETVGRRDAAVEPTWTYSRRVSAQNLGSMPDTQANCTSAGISKPTLATNYSNDTASLHNALAINRVCPHHKFCLNMDS